MKRLAAMVLAVATATACADRPDPVTGPSDLAASARTTIDQSAKPLDIAVIGDTPYGGSAIALFPALVRSINGDAKVRDVVHVGDLKSGSELCSDARLQLSVDLYNTFKDPFIYAVGDNEWTDCHRANNGGYNPLDRLAKVRALVYPVPGHPLGGRGNGETVQSQDGYPENQLWVESRVTFATLHVIGSNNGLDPWFGDRASGPETAAEGAARQAEVAGRQAANLAWLDRAFATARAEGARGVVLFYQADLWHPEDRAGGADFSAHQAWVERLAWQANHFDGQVLLVSGDSHDYRVDVGVPWMSTYYGTPATPNITQVIVDRTIEAGDAAGEIEWLRLHVDPKSASVFSWERVIVQ